MGVLAASPHLQVYVWERCRCEPCGQVQLGGGEDPGKEGQFLEKSSHPSPYAGHFPCQTGLPLLTFLTPRAET